MAEILRYRVKILLKHHKALWIHRYRYKSTSVSVLHKIMGTHTRIYKLYAACFNTLTFHEPPIVKCLKRIKNCEKKILQITNFTEYINARVFPVSQHIILMSDDTYVAIFSVRQGHYAQHCVVADKAADFHSLKAKTLEELFYPMFPDFGKSTNFWKVSSLSRLSS